MVHLFRPLASVLHFEDILGQEGCRSDGNVGEFLAILRSGCRIFSVLNIGPAMPTCFVDLGHDVTRRPSMEFQNTVSRPLTASQTCKNDKIARIDKINILAYVVASYTNLSPWIFCKDITRLEKYSSCGSTAVEILMVVSEHLIKSANMS